jgi:hypothetical protein
MRKGTNRSAPAHVKCNQARFAGRPGAKSGTSPAAALPEAAAVPSRSRCRAVPKPLPAVPKPLPAVPKPLPAVPKPLPAVPKPPPRRSEGDLP